MSRVKTEDFEDKNIHKKNSPGYRYKTTLTINPTWMDTGNYVCHYKTKNTELHVANDRTEIYLYFQGISIFSFQSDRFIMILCILCL